MGRVGVSRATSASSADVSSHSFTLDLARVAFTFWICRARQGGGGRLLEGNESGAKKSMLKRDKAPRNMHLEQELSAIVDEGASLVEVRANALVIHQRLQLLHAHIPQLPVDLHHVRILQDTPDLSMYAHVFSSKFSALDELRPAFPSSFHQTCSVVHLHFPDF